MFKDRKESQRKEKDQSSWRGKNRKLTPLCSTQALNGEHEWKKEKQQVLSGPTELNIKINEKLHSSFIFFPGKKRRDRSKIGVKGHLDTMIIGKMCF